MASVAPAPSDEQAAVATDAAIPDTTDAAIPDNELVIDAPTGRQAMRDQEQFIDICYDPIGWFFGASFYPSLFLLFFGFATFDELYIKTFHRLGRHIQLCSQSIL